MCRTVDFHAWADEHFDGWATGVRTSPVKKCDLHKILGCVGLVYAIHFFAEGLKNSRGKHTFSFCSQRFLAINNAFDKVKAQLCAFKLHHSPADIPQHPAQDLPKRPVRSGVLHFDAALRRTHFDKLTSTHELRQMERAFVEEFFSQKHVLTASRNTGCVTS